MRNNLLLTAGVMLLVGVPSLFTAAIINCVLSMGAFTVLGIGTLVCMVAGAFIVAYVAQKEK